MKFPRLSRKTWIAIGLVVLLGVFVFMSRNREGMENPPASELLARAQAIKAKMLPLSSSGSNADSLLSTLQMVFLSFAKDSSLNVDPAVLSAFESKNFDALKSLIVVDPDLATSNEVAEKSIGYRLSPGGGITLRRFTIDVIDMFSNMTRDFQGKPAPPPDTPAGGVFSAWNEISRQANAVFTVATPPPTSPSPSAPPSSATYSASCSKCSVINNQITCACDVLPK